MLAFVLVGLSTSNADSASAWTRSVPLPAPSCSTFFRTEGVHIVKTPIRAPRANAFAERWVRTLRTECLDWLLVLGRRHLEDKLRTYMAHYNEARPRRGLALKTPEPQRDPAPPSEGSASDGVTY